MNKYRCCNSCGTTQPLNNEHPWLVLKFERHLSFHFWRLTFLYVLGPHNLIRIKYEMFTLKICDCGWFTRLFYRWLFEVWSLFSMAQTFSTWRDNVEDRWRLQFSILIRLVILSTFNWQLLNCISWIGEGYHEITMCTSKDIYSKDSWSI